LYNISHTRPLPKSARNGFTQTLRDMQKGDSVDIPSSKKTSAYSAARLAGVKITIRDGGKGVAVVWRLDGSEPTPETNIFGEPIAKSQEVFK
jgi:hypothetical protein